MAGNPKVLTNKNEIEAVHVNVRGVLKAYDYIKRTLPKWKQVMRDADWFESDIDYLQWQLDICDAPTIRKSFEKAMDPQRPYAALDTMRSHYTRMMDVMTDLQRWEKDPAKAPWNNSARNRIPYWKTRPGFVTKLKLR